MEKTYCSGTKKTNNQIHRDFKQHLYLCIQLGERWKAVRENTTAISFEVMRNPYPWSLTERVIHWPRHFSSCPLLLMCCVHLSHQMCLCAASNTRCTQCWNAQEKYIQRLDRALALSQHSEVGMATAVQSSPHPLLAHQPPSLFKNAPCLPYIGSCHHR